MRTLFEYLRPKDLAEAVAMKAAHGEAARFWAGGTDMTLHWKQERFRPDYCIDLSYLPGLDGIHVGSDRIRIGAKTTLRTLERTGGHPLLATLARVSRLMCTVQTRALATVGGNMCTASPAADLSPVLVAMGAVAVIAGQGGDRRMPLVAFFEGVNRTALRGGELLAAVEIPLAQGQRPAAAYRRIERTVVDIALVNAGVFLAADAGGRIAEARIGLGAVAPVILTADEAAEMLKGQPLAALDEALLARAGEAAAAVAKPITDVRASADYRREMVAVMVRRALADAVAQLRSQG
jgi:carbon-monoxide dehydrogenase medium subunit